MLNLWREVTGISHHWTTLTAKTRNESMFSIQANKSLLSK